MLAPKIIFYSLIGDKEDLGMSLGQTAEFCSGIADGFCKHNTLKDFDKCLTDLRSLKPEILKVIADLKVMDL